MGITDHDCVDGVDAAVEEGLRLNVDVLAGVEMSVGAGNWDVHLLGYKIETGDKELREYLKFFGKTRAVRAATIVDKLNELGVDLKLSTVLEIGGRGSVGRLHVARALVQENLCADVETAFRKYLGDRGPAFVEKHRIPADEAIAVIHKAGGKAFLAHPGFYDDEELIYSLFDDGLDGLEVYNPKHRGRQINRFREIVQEFDGLASGGSDFHGGRLNGPPLGRFKVPYSLAAKIIETGSAQDMTDINRHETSEPGRKQDEC